MAYLVDVDVFNITPQQKCYGRRLYLDSNGVLYCAFRNLNDEIELKKSYDGGQSWQHLASVDISSVPTEKKDLLFIDKKNQVFVAYNFRKESIMAGCSVLYEDNIVQNWLELGHYIEDSNGCILEDKIGYITNYNSAGNVGVQGEDFDSASFFTGWNLYDRFLHSYSEDSVLISWRYDDAPNNLYLGIYQKGNNVKKYLYWENSSDRIQSYFRLIKISDLLYYFVAHEKDPADSKYKVNLYKWDFENNVISLVDTVVDTTNTDVQPIIQGNYAIAKDGYNNVYIMYVKELPDDYLFVRKFDFATKTLESEQQLTDFKVRLPQMVSSLPNSNKIYYTYQRMSD